MALLWCLLDYFIPKIGLKGTMLIILTEVETTKKGVFAN